MPPLALAITAAALVFGCDNPATRDVVIDLVTDLQPDREFTRVRVTLESSDGGGRSFEAERDASGNFIEGERVAELFEVPDGEYRLEVELLRGAEHVGSQPALVTISGPFATTVFLMRSCVDNVRCPPPDDPEALSCLDGQCVTSACVLDDPPPECPSRCTRDEDCVPPVACGASVCTRVGVCAHVPDDSDCLLDGEVCDPVLGCVGALPDDGGVDAGTDAGSDAGPPAPPVLTRTIGLPPANSVVAFDVGPDGSVAVAGTLTAPTDFGDGLVIAPTGGRDIYLALYRPSLELAWVSVWGQVSRNVETRGVAVDRDGNLFLSGSVSSAQIDFGGGPVGTGSIDDENAFLASFDATGTHRYSRLIAESPSEYLEAGPMRADPVSGRVVMVSKYIGMVTIGGRLHTTSGSDVWGDWLAIGYSPDDGSAVFSYHFGGGSQETIQALTMGPEGRLFIDVHFRSGSRWNGSVSGIEPTGYDTLVAQLRVPEGVQGRGLVWGSDLLDSAGGSTLADPGGDVLITGSFAGTIDLGGSSADAGTRSDLLVARVTSSGSYVWSAIGSGTGAWAARGVERASDGAWVVLATFNSGGNSSFGGRVFSSVGGTDLVLIVLEPDGALRSLTTMGGTGNEMPVGLRLTSDDAAIIVTQASEGIDFGGGPVAPSARQMVIARIPIL